MVYEIAMLNPDKVGIISKAYTGYDMSKYDKTHGLKLLLFADESKKIIKGCYMAIEATSNTDLEKVHYKKTNGLSGYVIYYNLDGSTSNGVVYSNGKPIYKIKNSSESEVMMVKKQIESGGDRNVQGCSTQFIETGYTYCVYTPYSENCGWQSTGYSSYTTCDQEEDVNQDPDSYTGGGGGGGGGGNGNSTSGPPILKEIKVDSTARPCVDTIATAVISKAAEIQNVLSNLLSLSNVNASAAISTMANSSTYKIKIGEHLFNDQTKYNSDGSSYLIRKNGVTNDTTGFIYLNKLMLNDGTDLAVAATLIHELMHSYMVYGIHHTTGLERDVFRDMNMFLFDQSGAPFANQGVPQHIQMANTYVNSMAALLTSYATSRGILTSPDSSISLSEYCKDIFWQDLQHSQAYIAAPNKNRSASNGEREYKNTYNSTKKKKC
ncbi:hypothetical protein [Pedobacter ureilyticus]|uniref:Lysine-specific metallo-endopeptidase domain-containing protein n=1 Tax=Pedobacter ureilyticus TaxID=1393051 RepID=A0ABW9JAN5_9SPHI|nr:hypothetical protein [Pedobacter helvus]